MTDNLDPANESGLEAAREGQENDGFLGRLVAWHDRRRLSSEERKECLDALAIRSDEPWWPRFFIVMLVSVVIATAGLLLDSAAVVIGAMLIAPLMTPVLALSASLAMGWPRHAVRQAAGLIGATVAAIGVAWLIGSFVPRDHLTNEVLSRTSPDLRDLVVALAAGFGGAYVTVRRNMAGSLPGVAVAVALVPPLGAVGLTLAAGRGDLARGAALLYGANLAAIVLSGLAVFLLTGFVPARRISFSWGRVTAGATLVVVAVTAISVPLAQQSARAVSNTQQVEDINRRVNAWLDESPDRVSRVGIDGDTVTVAIAGPAEPPPVASLRGVLEEVVGPDLDLQVRWTQQSDPQSESENDEGDSATATTSPTVALPTVEAVEPLIVEWLSQSDAPVESFEITNVEVGTDNSVMIELRSETAPPNSDGLSSLIDERLDVSLRVTIEWSESSGGDNDQPSDDLIAAIRAIARQWAQSQPSGLTVENVRLTGGVAHIDLTGQTPPTDAASLAKAIEAQIQQPPPLEVRFTAIQIIPTQTTTTTTASTTSTTATSTTTTAPTTTASTTPADG